MGDVIHTTDRKLASILAVQDIPIRWEQPITCSRIEKDGKPWDQYTIWFDVEGKGVKDKAKSIINDYYDRRDDIRAMVRNGSQHGEKTVSFDDNDLMAKLISVQMFNEVFLHWMKSKVEPMKTVQMGDKTVTLSVNATAKTKDRIRQLT